ncbi:MAG: hypothetical protein J07HX5_02055 [halophilic archaeon J07HX5]|nr:MAG: hypothetical protein J07HX5_02055 [halophilic archaeon J07HX5]
MNKNQRTQVKNNAQYLKQVRPIDPAEIAEYVEGRPHPAGVRQTLRESAPELGLRERSDGRFEPVADGPTTLAPVTQRLPEQYTRRIESLLVDQFGPGWPDGTSGDRLRATIREFKHQYLRGESVSYDKLTALGYLVYHLPAYFAAVQHVLAELAANDRLGHRVRVLDVGAGVGGPAVGLATALPEDVLVEYHGVEPSAAAEILETLLGETSRNVHTTVHRERIQAFEPERPFDLVCVQTCSRSWPTRRPWWSICSRRSPPTEPSQPLHRPTNGPQPNFERLSGRSRPAPMRRYTPQRSDSGRTRVQRASAGRSLSKSQSRPQSSSVSSIVASEPTAAQAATVRSSTPTSSSRTRCSGPTDDRRSRSHLTPDRSRRWPPPTNT